MPDYHDAAAIFDLDRTVIPGPSGPIFQRHLREAGLGANWEPPMMDQFFKAFERFGENWLTMRLARLSARASRGWPVEAVRRAAEGAAKELMDKVQPYARLLLEEHRAAGRRLVMATTSPACLVSPFATLLGFDAVVATAWAEGPDGKYTGEIDGPFVWGRGKLVAVRKWAAATGVELRKSYAYSDSFFDGGLLAEVGHPVAVNPDPQLAALARLQRWPVRHLDVAPGVLKLAGRELQEWFRPLNRPEFVPNARFEFSGQENIPSTGSAILVFNHRSYFDSAAVNLLIAKTGRPARFLGKKEVFDAPIIGQMMKAFGGIRVVRASGSDEPLEEAAAALAAGELISLAPQGTIPRGSAFFDPELKGRWGAARLAALTGAPVIPVGLWGTEKVWPRSSRLPKMSGRPPLITVNVGKPVELTHDDPEADTARIMSAIAALLPPEAREYRDPTAEELALTYPPGYRGDDARESSRRPGTDA